MKVQVSCGVEKLISTIHKDWRRKNVHIFFPIFTNKERKMNKNKHEHVAKNNFCINLCYLVFDLVYVFVYIVYIIFVIIVDTGLLLNQRSC